MIYEIKNWREYQHYKDRNPPWIKLHVSLLSSEDWVALADASRVLAIACMVIASKNDGRINGTPEGLRYLERVAYLNQPPNLRPLLDTGFLIPLADASTMLADASTMHTNARPEERRGEAEKRQRREEEETNTETETYDMITPSQLEQMLSSELGLISRSDDRLLLNSLQTITRESLQAARETMYAKAKHPCWSYLLKIIEGQRQPKRGRPDEPAPVVLDYDKLAAEWGSEEWEALEDEVAKGGAS